MLGGQWKYPEWQSRKMPGSVIHPWTAGCAPPGSGCWGKTSLCLSHRRLGFYKLWPNLCLSDTVSCMPFITMVGLFLYSWAPHPPAQQQAASDCSWSLATWGTLNQCPNCITFETCGIFVTRISTFVFPDSICFYKIRVNVGTQSTV